MATPNKKVVLEWIRKLAAGKQTVTLVLRRGDRWGWIGFRGGEIVSARTQASQGMAALDALLLWWDAELFGDTSLSEEGPGNLPMGTDEVCAIADKYLDEVSEVAGGLDLLGRYRAAPESEAREKLDGDTAAVLSLLDGRRALVDALEDSPYNVFWTLRAVKSLAAADIAVAG